MSQTPEFPPCLSDGEEALDRFIEIFKLHAGIKPDFQWAGSSFHALEIRIRTALAQSTQSPVEGLLELAECWNEARKCRNWDQIHSDDWDRIVNRGDKIAKALTRHEGA